MIAEIEDCSVSSLENVCSKMTRHLFWIVACLCVVSACDPAVLIVSAVCTSGQEPCLDIPLALKSAAELPCVELSLLSQPLPYQVSVPMQVTNSLVLRGEEHVLLYIAEIVSVLEQGSLNVTGVTMRQGANTEAGFEIAGSLTLYRVRIESFASPFVRLSGRINFSESSITQCTAETIAVYTGNVTITISAMLFSYNSASLLRIQPKYSSQLPFALSVEESVFANNSLTAFLVAITHASGIASFARTQFTSNVGKLVQIEGTRSQIMADFCAFEDNEDSLLTGALFAAFIRISDSSFRNNSGIAFDFPQFDGSFVFNASLLTQHRTRGPVSLANHDIGAQCFFTALQSTFSDSDISVSGPTPGLISLYACSCEFFDIRVLNFTVTSTTFDNLRGFIFVNLGHFAGRNVYMESSGTTGFLIAVFVGDLTLTEFVLKQTYSNAGMQIGGIVGRTRIAHGYVTPGSVIPPVLFPVLLARMLYFGAMQGVAVIQNITIENSPQELGGSCGFYFADVTIREIRIRNAVIGVVATVLEGTFSVANAYITDSVFTMYPYGASGSKGSYSNIVMENCSAHATMSRIGVFLAVDRSDVSVDGVLIDHIVAPTLMRIRNSKYYGLRFSISSCRFDYLIHYPLLSQVNFRDLAVRATAMQLFFDMRSAITFSDAYFEGLYSPGLLVGGYGTQFTLSNTTFSRLTTQGALGKFQQDSNIRIEESRFSNVTCSDLQGWLIQGGSLTISDSRFADYHTVLFQVTSANVTIRNSLFLNGVNPTTSLISPTAYGGVLHCTDCPQVAVTRLTAVNATASFGGALVFMRNKEESFVKISQSEFVACRALQGGAVFMQNVSFVIESSIFRQNVANTTGGALKAAIKPSQHAMIRHSMFTRNWATQGGGIEWSNAPVLLINTSFVENRADYGPDVASYGIVLSSRLTRFQGNETSGSPIIVVFEFLDHYNHRVSLSPFVYTRLSSSRSIGFNGNEIKMYHRGWFNYSDLVVYARPGVSHTITATLKYSQEDYYLNLAGTVNVRFRNCTAGEVYHSDHCEYCFPGYFSFSPDDRNCRLCPGNATCPGGNQISINPGFWTKSWNSTQVIACPLPSKCLGGPNSTCAPGFAGKVCNECSAGAFRVRGTECVECWGSVGVAFQFIIPVALYVLFIMTVQRYSHTDHKSVKLFALKVCVSHFQLLCVPSYLRMSFTPATTYFLHGVSYVSSFSVPDLPMHCFEIPRSAYSNAALCSFLPLLLICLSAIAYNGFGLMNKEDFWISVSSTLLLCPVISIQTLIPLLSCFQVDSEQALLFVDMQEVCWEGTRRKLVYAFVLPSLILTVAFPLAVGLVLGCYRPEVFDQYFPLWSSGYKWRGWEVFFCVTRCSLISLSILTLRSPNLVQLCYCFCALIVMCVLNVLFSRVVYINSRCFALCECSWSVLCLSIGFLSYFMEWQPGESKGEVFFVAMVLILNVGYVCLCAYTFVRRDSSSARKSSESVDFALDTGLKAPPPSLIIY